MTWGQLFTSPKRILLTLANVLLIGIGTTIVRSFLHFPFSYIRKQKKKKMTVLTTIKQCVCGLWVSGVAIHNDASKSSFSCANNA